MGEEGRREIRSSLAPGEEASRALRVLEGVCFIPSIWPMPQGLPRDCGLHRFYFDFL